MTAGEVVKNALETSGIKQSYVASKLSISNSTLSSTLKREISLALFVKICDICGFDAESLFSIYRDNQKEEAKNG